MQSDAAKKKEGNQAEMKNASVAATFDGACEPYNPDGHMGLGWAIGEEQHRRYIAAAATNTNNVAEYLAIIEILRWALEQTEAATLQITGDSQLVVYQLDGEYSVRARVLLPYFEEAKYLLHQLRDRGWMITIRWLSRERNEVADQLSKLALQENGVTPTQRSPAAGYTDRLGDIGEEVGLSAVTVGKVLTRLGLRVALVASDAAIELGLAVTRYNGYGIFTDWHCDRVADLVRTHAQAEIARAAQAKAKADRKQWQAERAAAAAAAEKDRIAALGMAVRRRIEADGGTLIDTIEDLIEDLADRPAVYLQRRGWWLNRLVTGLKRSVPEEMAKICAAEAAIQREYTRLQRRAAA